MKNRMMKVFSLAVTMLMIMLISAQLIPLAACAEKPDTWGAYAAPVKIGNLIIDTAEELAGFAAAVNGGADFAGFTIALANDIDLSAHQWEAIGTNTAFRGIFDGNGYTVSGMTITTGNLQGFFGKLGGATVKELTVGGSINTAEGSCHAGIAALASGGDNEIINCVNRVCVKASAMRGAGIIAAVEGGVTNIGYCVNENSVNGGYAAGGLVATVANAVLNICDSRNTGIVTAANNSNYSVAGGIVAMADTGANVTVKNSSNNATVTYNASTNVAAGGLLGYGKSGIFRAYNCYNFASMNGTVTGQLAGFRKSGTVSLYYSYYYGYNTPNRLSYNTVNVKSTCRSYTSLSTLIGLLNQRAASYGDVWSMTGYSYPKVVSPAVDADITIIVEEPAVTEPVVTEPEVTEPVVTEPVVTEPEVTEPVVTEPVVYYTVTFVSNGGTAVASVKVARGDTLTLPAAPTRAGYTFVGWYTARTLRTEFNASSTPITASRILYAKWKGV